MIHHRPSLGYASGGSWMPVLVFIAALLLALGITGGCYAWTRADCENRGGHIEIIWGDELQWQCDGATR